MQKQLFSVMALAMIIALSPTVVNAITIYGIEQTSPEITYTQPNEGTPVTFDAKLWGDALLWERETQDGYTVVQNCSTGFWMYNET